MIKKTLPFLTKKETDKYLKTNSMKKRDVLMKKSKLRADVFGWLVVILAGVGIYQVGSWIWSLVR